MELTVDFLKEKGFTTNHPERALAEYSKSGSEPTQWYICVEQEYLLYTNQLMFHVFCWKTNKNGTIVKRSSASFINTVEELIQIADICSINI